MATLHATTVVCTENEFLQEASYCKEHKILASWDAREGGVRTIVCLQAAGRVNCTFKCWPLYLNKHPRVSSEEWGTLDEEIRYKESSPLCIKQRYKHVQLLSYLLP